MLEAETNQWIGDSLLSLCVLAGFIVAKLVLEENYPSAMPYVDPAMVILASSFFLILPGKSLWSAFRELLFVSPKEDVVAPVRAEVDRISLELGAQSKIHVIKIGRQLEVEANFLIENETISISQMDAIRGRLEAIVLDAHEKAWININFTQQESEL